MDSGYVVLGENYISNSSKAKRFNKRDSENDLGDLITAHKLLLGIIGSILEQAKGADIPNKPAVRRKFVLVSGFIQGIPLCEQSILQSMYLQSASLIRQEQETLGLLGEIKSGTRKDRVNVNIKYAPWDGGRLYGELSTLAHLCDHSLLNEIVGYNNSWGDYSSSVPQYNKDKTRDFYCFHLVMVCGLILNLFNLYYDVCEYKPSKRETDVFDIVISILIKEETLKIDQKECYLCRKPVERISLNS